MIRNIHCMIMVIWSTLIFGMDILQYNITNPSAIFDIQFRTQHHVLEGIHKEAMAFLALPLLSFAITIIIKHKHLTVILEEMICINAQLPGISIIVDAHEPRPQLVAGNIGILTFTIILSARNKSMPHSL